MLTVADQFCPNVRNKLCTDIYTLTNCSFSGFPYASELEQIVSYFQGAQGLVLSQIGTFREDLVKMQYAAIKMSDRAATFNWEFYMAMVFSLLLGVLCVLLMMGVLFAWKRTLPRFVMCLRDWMILPLFVFLVIFSWLFCMVFIIASIGLADLCIDSPDPRILAIVHHIQERVSPVIIQFLVFYINGTS